MVNRLFLSRRRSAGISNNAEADRRIVDWIMEHGSDEAGRAQLPGGGCFDPIEEMEAVYDRYAGHSSLSVSEAGWKLE